VIIHISAGARGRDKTNRAKRHKPCNPPDLIPYAVGFSRDRVERKPFVREWRRL